MGAFMLSVSEPISASAIRSSVSMLVLEPLQEDRLDPIVLGPGKTTLGSSDSCTAVLKVPGVQPLHCSIFRGARRTVLKAWDPRTWVNDAPAQEELLRPGDRIAIGPLEFRVREATVDELLDHVPVAKNNPFVGTSSSVSTLPSEPPRRSVGARVDHGASGTRSLSEAIRQAIALGVLPPFADELLADRSNSEPAPGRPLSELPGSAARPGQTEEQYEQIREQLCQSLEALNRELAQQRHELEAALQDIRRASDMARSRAVNRSASRAAANPQLDRLLEALRQLDERLSAVERSLQEKTSHGFLPATATDRAETTSHEDQCHPDAAATSTKERPDDESPAVPKAPAAGEESDACETRLQPRTAPEPTASAVSDPATTELSVALEELRAVVRAEGQSLQHSRDELNTLRRQYAAARQQLLEEQLRLETERAVLNEEQAVAEEDGAELEARFEELRERQRELQKEREALQAFRESIELVERELEAVRAEVDRTRIEVRQNEQTLRDKRSQLQQLQTAALAERKALARELDELSEQQERLGNEQTQLERQREELVARRAELETRRSGLQQQWQQLQLEREAIEDDRKTIEAELAELDLEAEKLSEKKRELDQERHQLTEQRAKLEAQKADVDAGRRKYDAESAELAREAQRLRSEADELQAEQESLQTAETELQQRREELQQQREELERQKSELHARSEQLEQDERTVEAEAAELAEAFDRLEDERSRLKQREAELQAAQQDLVTRRERLHDEQTELRQRHDQVQHELASANEELKALETERHELESSRSELERLQEELANRQAELEEVRVALQSRRVELEQRQKELEDLRDRTEHEETTLTAELESVEEEIRRTEQERERLQTQRGDVDEKRRTLEDRRGELQQKRRELEELRGGLSDEEATLNSELAAVEEEIRQAEQERERLTSREDALKEKRQLLQVRRSELEDKRRGLESLRTKLRELESSLTVETEELERERQELLAEEDELKSQMARTKSHQETSSDGDVPRSGGEVESQQEPIGPADESADEADRGSSGGEALRNEAVEEVLARLRAKYEKPEKPKTGSNPRATDRPAGCATQLITAKYLRAASVGEATSDGESSESKPSTGSQIGPDVSAAACACSSNVIVEDATDELSIAKYMNSLLERSRERQRATTDGSDTGHCASSDGFRGDQRDVCEQATAEKTPSEQDAESPYEPGDNPADSESVEPSPRSEEVREKLRANLDSLREVANQSARSAIADSLWRRMGGSLALKAVLTVVPGGLAVWFLILAQRMGCSSIYLKLGWACVGIGVLMGIELIRSFLVLRRLIKIRRGEVRLASDAASLGLLEKLAAAEVQSNGVEAEQSEASKTP
ncbi:MAG: hypothetical protein GXP27_09650 [Planctomycetes bacterium]|nr:hypothetical protein [Planctomycetota bacterium]